MVKDMLRQINKKNKKKISRFFVLDKNKKGVSLIISYVILISISIGIGITVFSMLKYYPNIIKPPEACKEGTSLVLYNYNCSYSSSVLTNLELNLKNNGLFNIGGFILQVGNESGRIPVERIAPKDSKQGFDWGAGYYVFNNSVKPGEIGNANFTIDSDYGKDISMIQVQAMIISEEGQKIPCDASIKRQPITDCDFVETPAP
jgi:hypothetical protein